MRKLPLSYIQSHTRLSYIYFEPPFANAERPRARRRKNGERRNTRRYLERVRSKCMRTQCFRDVRHFNKNGDGIPKVFHLERTNFSWATFRHACVYVRYSCRRRVCRYSNCYEYRLPNYANNDPGIRYQREIGGEKGEIRHERRRKKLLNLFVRLCVPLSEPGGCTYRFRLYDPSPMYPTVHFVRVLFQPIRPSNIYTLSSHFDSSVL